MNKIQIRITGVFLVPEGETNDTVTEKFLQWVESVGWLFTGGTMDVTDDEEGQEQAQLQIVNMMSSENVTTIIALPRNDGSDTKEEEDSPNDWQSSLPPEIENQ